MFSKHTEFPHYYAYQLYYNHLFTYLYHPLDYKPSEGKHWACLIHHYIISTKHNIDTKINII